MLRRRRPSPIDSDVVTELIGATCPLRRRIPAPLVEGHRHLTSHLVSTWRWEGERGSDVDLDVRVMIAAHTALMGIGLPSAHDTFGSISPIIVHRRPIVQRGPHRDSISGIVSDGPMRLAGQAHHRGPVLLDVGSVRRESRHPERGQHVVIHEMAHRLDMLDGVTDGTPPLGDDGRLAVWVGVCTPLLDALRSGVPSPALRPYAATNPAEFFAVASEAFWCVPGRLAEHHPDLHRVLADFYGVLPLVDPHESSMS